MNRLRNHLTVEEIEWNYQNSQDPVESRRWQLLLQVAHSPTIKEAAATLELDYDYALGIVRRYNELGPKTVQNHRKIPWKQRSDL